MKSFTIIKICLFALFFAPYYIEEVSGQALYPMYGGAPIPYDNREEDDLGLLLTVLLLAARNRNNQNCNCCNCCNCGSGTKSIPVPFPIPFPTNNPIINNQSSRNTNDDDSGNEKTVSNSESSQQSFQDLSSTNYTLTYVPVPIGQNQASSFEQ